MENVVSANNVKVFEQYLGKEVFIVMKDGYRKKGKLVSVEGGFARLWYLSGRQEIIDIAEIRSMAPNVFAKE